VTSLIKCISNPQIADKVLSKDRTNYLYSDDILRQVINFHRSIPNYSATPLIELKELSNKLNLKNILVKDESQRFELNAFKMLGASFAIAALLVKKLGLKDSEITYVDIIKYKNQYQDLVFATATDGNHGRAVAWSAKLFGCHSRIYMPKGSSSFRLNAIKNYTSNAEITEMDYDDTVKFVEQQSKINGWELIQDTAWPGYVEVPNNIMRGYFSLLYEFEAQSSGQWPSHVLLQAGVGSMAASIAAYLKSHKNPTPKIILVEPVNAPCFFESIKINDGLAHQCGNLETLMAGLACGLPSMTAWEILKLNCDFFVICDDQLSIDGMKRYAYPLGNDTLIKSGESGAVTLGVIERMMIDKKLEKMKRDLGLNHESTVLLLSTEGDTDPDFYQKTINEK